MSSKTMYQRWVLNKPVLVILLLLALLAAAGFYSTKFKLDASADTLLLENDESLAYYRGIRASYGDDDFLIVTYTPNDALFSISQLNHLQSLVSDLRAIDGIASVTSLLDVPLINSPKTTLSELSEKIRTLRDEDTDIGLAKAEVTNSPFYTNLLVSEDGKTTAMQLNLVRDEKYVELLTQREALRKKEFQQALTSEEKNELSKVSLAFSQHTESLQAKQQALIASVRQVMSTYKTQATLHLGGVPMIASDSIDFVRHDLYTFGVGVLAFVVVLLLLAFKEVRWVAIPLVNCAAAGVLMIGLLGLLNWPVTVVSSNFVSLMLIITLSLNIHLIVHYRESQSNNPDWTQAQLVNDTMSQKFYPCLYTALTTVVGFGSLVVSGIRPVIDFGWMMSLGVIVAFLVSFTLFPALLMLTKAKAGHKEKDAAITVMMTNALAKASASKSNSVLAGALIVFVTAILGITQLTVENRFIDYFKPETEIYQGMSLIDEALGGTTPLDVIIDAPPAPKEELVAEKTLDDEDKEDVFDELDVDLSEFEDASEDQGITSTSFWFNSYQLKQVKEIHDYLDSIPQTGKVLSLNSTVEMLRIIDSQVADDNFLLSLVHKQLNDDLKAQLLAPYLSEDGNQLRFSIRIFESDKNLQRDALLAKIEGELSEKFNIAPERIHLTGMAVLYNNMLQSLFKSQIMTLGLVFIMICITFLILFKNFTVSLLAIAPNITTALLVLGVMGLADIPLDMMTITIAAICIGIAVDNAIHYVYRFRSEIENGKDYQQALQASHGSIGRAIYYTSLTVTLGFSILVLSNFIPSIYFGLLTGMAMLVALVANLTLLPVLLTKFKPFKTA